jgi:hypothetical protein
MATPARCERRQQPDDVVSKVANVDLPVPNHRDTARRVQPGLYGRTVIAAVTLPLPATVVTQSFGNNTRILSCCVGNGTMGFSGDGGRAVDAEFGYPQVSAWMRAANLHIPCHSGDNAVRHLADDTVSPILGCTPRPQHQAVSQPECPAWVLGTLVAGIVRGAGSDAVVMMPAGYSSDAAVAMPSSSGEAVRPLPAMLR